MIPKLNYHRKRSNKAIRSVLLDPNPLMAFMQIVEDSCLAT
jgi:hypothetical protein